MALLLFVFSPTFLAHTRYVTTDVGAAAAFFIATYYIIKWLKDSSSKNLIYAGIAFGLAMLTKFSLALLVPYFVLIVFVFSLIQSKKLKNYHFKKNALTLAKKAVGLILIGLIALVLIWPVYQYHVANYPESRQHHDMASYFEGVTKFRPAIDKLIWMSDKPILRPYAQYVFGLIMVMRRTAGGNTAYFLGQVNNQSWWYYFPVVYFLKVPLTIHILTIIALFYALCKIKKPYFKKIFSRTYIWTKKYFTEFAMLAFLAVYWIVSIRSNLNIGVRHVLPTFPFMYVLVSGQVAQWIKIPWKKIRKQNDLFAKMKVLFIEASKTYFKYVVLIVLIGWYLIASIMAYPHYLAYFNESVGGAKNGHNYVLDSNLDWGQDLKRLTQWVNDNNIDNIHVHYFGGADPKYYLGEKYWPWWGDRNPADIKAGQWLAVSATLLQEGRGKATAGFDKITDYYLWLDKHNLITTIGHSIFVYQMKQNN